MTEQAPTIITVREMGYVEAMDCHDARGRRRCDWCKKPATFFVRQSIHKSGFHMGIAPKCVVCAGVEKRA